MREKFLVVGGPEQGEMHEDWNAGVLTVTEYRDPPHLFTADMKPSLTPEPPRVFRYRLVTIRTPEVRKYWIPHDVSDEGATGYLMASFEDAIKDSKRWRCVR